MVCKDQVVDRHRAAAYSHYPLQGKPQLQRYPPVTPFPDSLPLLTEPGRGVITSHLDLLGGISQRGLLQSSLPGWPRFCRASVT